ncbi:MAG TPA: hypothetical protein VJ024_09085 [Thermodesulfovibrionales bacterium]|nr:hypothetical protein [Thermodesulfovibrionales bacterium]
MKRIRVFMKTMCILALSGFFFAFATGTGQSGDMGLTQRPLSDFLNAQGTTNTFFPHVPDYVGWTDGEFVNFALVDYAGLADKYLIENCDTTVGTTVTGLIKERELPDGNKAEIRVKLHTKNAMGFAQLIEDIIANDFKFNKTDTIFGNKTKDVCEGEPAAVGEAKLDITFIIEEPGAVLPDLLDVVTTPSIYHPVTLEFKSTTFDGAAYLVVHQKATSVVDNDNLVYLFYTEEVVEIMGSKK